MEFVLIGILLYFLPSILGRNKRRFGALLAVNFFLGWTVVGWIVALFWGLTPDAPPMVNVQVQAATGPYCCSCGTLMGRTRYCTHCGVANA